MPKIRKGTMEQITTLNEIAQLVEDLLVYKKNVYVTIKDGCRPITSDCSKSIIGQNIAKQQIVPLIIKLLDDERHRIEEEIKIK